MLNSGQLQELLIQSLEHERGGVLVYETAVRCAVDEDLREEWAKYLEQTRRHVANSRRRVCEAFETRPGADVAGPRDRAWPRRRARRGDGEGAGRGQPDAAAARRERVRRACRDQGSRRLGAARRSAPKSSKATRQAALKAACEEVEDQEDEHLYHTKGWSRELWLDSLGLEGRAAAARGAQARQDGDRCREGAKGKRAIPLRRCALRAKLLRRARAGRRSRCSRLEDRS